MQGGLNLYRTARCRECAGALHEETITHGLDLAAAVDGEQLPQYLAVLVQQFEGKGFVSLRQCAVAHHVGEHDGREPSLLVDFLGVHTSPSPREIIFVTC